MPLEVRIEPRPDYLHVRVTGENSEENVLAYLRAVREACRERGCAAVLIEEHLDGPGLGEAAIFSIVSRAAPETAPLIRCIAYVDTNPEHAAGRMAFAENVAVNRGVNVRVFPAVSEAEAWLEQTGDKR